MILQLGLTYIVRQRLPDHSDIETEFLKKPRCELLDLLCYPLGVVADGRFQRLARWLWPQSLRDPFRAVENVATRIQQFGMLAFILEPDGQITGEHVPHIPQVQAKSRREVAPAECYILLPGAMRPSEQPRPARLRVEGNTKL